jgi:hypothetical protein
MARSRSSARTDRVTSTVRNSVTCGAVNALATMFSAVSFRTPLTGIRVSPPAAAGTTGALTAGAATAACTSSRVIEPCGPLPTRTARSTPRSRASLRTGGLARVFTPAAGAAGAACATAGTAGVAARGRRLATVVFGP